MRARGAARGSSASHQTSAACASVVLRPSGVEVRASEPPAPFTDASRERTRMCPGYQMSAGFQAGSDFSRRASARRRGGGRPAIANRARICPACPGVRSTRMTARWGSARETNASTSTRVVRSTLRPVVARPDGTGAHVEHLTVTSHGRRPCSNRASARRRTRRPRSRSESPRCGARRPPPPRTIPQGTRRTRRFRGRGPPRPMRPFPTNGDGDRAGSSDDSTKLLSSGEV